MEEIKFIAKVRHQGNSNIITIPKTINLEVEATYQFSIRKEPIK